MSFICNFYVFRAYVNEAIIMNCSNDNKKMVEDSNKIAEMNLKLNKADVKLSM